MANSKLAQDAMTSMWNVPRSALIFAVFSCLIGAAGTALYWESGLQFTPSVIIGQIVAAILWVASAFAVTMGILGRTPTFPAFIRYTATWIAAAAPLIAACVLIFLVPEGWHREIVLPSFITLLVLGAGVLLLLPSWPVAQALSARPISPLLLLKLTKGDRWQLVMLWFFLGAISKLSPDLKSASSSAKAGLMIFGDFLINVVTMLLIASIGAAAWRYAARKDPALQSEVDAA